MIKQYQLLLSSTNKSLADLQSLYDVAIKLLPESDEITLQTHQYPSLCLLKSLRFIEAEFNIAAVKQRLIEYGQQYAIDINLLPTELLNKKPNLIMMDVDSTMIKQESIDELAKFCDIHHEVAAITEQAMRGELDFTQALQQRLLLIKGLKKQEFLDVAVQCVAQDGLVELLQWAKKKQIQTACVSGGFSIIVEQLQQQFGIDYALAQQLVFVDNTFTGELPDIIIDSDKKLSYLFDLCNKLTITPQQLWAIGDGANDIKMIKQAGLGIGIHPKPELASVVDLHLCHTGLDLLCHLTQ